MKNIIILHDNDTIELVNEFTFARMDLRNHIEFVMMPVGLDSAGVTQYLCFNRKNLEDGIIQSFESCHVKYRVTAFIPTDETYQYEPVPFKEMELDITNIVDYYTFMHSFDLNINASEITHWEYTELTGPVMDITDFVLDMKIGIKHIHFAFPSDDFDISDSRQLRWYTCEVIRNKLAEAGLYYHNPPTNITSDCIWIDPEVGQWAISDGLEIEEGSYAVALPSDAYVFIAQENYLRMDAIIYGDAEASVPIAYVITHEDEFMEPIELARLVCEADQYEIRASTNACNVYRYEINHIEDVIDICLNWEYYKSYVQCVGRAIDYDIPDNDIHVSYIITSEPDKNSFFNSIYPIEGDNNPPLTIFMNDLYRFIKFHYE